MEERNWEVLGRDWFGDGVAPEVFYSVGLVDGFCEVVARREGKADVGEDVAGAFVEGLWRRDVVEVFLGAEGRENYLEMHISPNGCWWVGEFRGDEREVISNWGAEGPGGFFAEGKIAEGGWESSLRVPVEFLEGRMGGEVRAWRGNVVGMVTDDAGARRYLTANVPEDREGRPDFHRRELRRKMKL